MQSLDLDDLALLIPLVEQELRLLESDQELCAAADALVERLKETQRNLRGVYDASWHESSGRPSYRDCQRIY